MKSRLLSNRAVRSGSPASGFVLITVLIVLALLVILVVAFLLRVTTERSSSTGFRGSASARELADMAVGLVQGQISLATTQEPTNVWCSQPGMVRTYEPDGTLYNAFKLYSSTNMVLTSATQLGITGGVSPDVAPADWASSPALWTDLNAPTPSPSGTNVYPIVDPGATNAAYGPAGFTVSSAPGATPTQPFPMPVQWLYVLADGSIVAPTGSGSTVTVPGANSSDKAIVGRIAFWTDDNTCRVNINTASAGTFWDVPRAYSTNSGTPVAGLLTQEQALGYYQPVQKEFQRYPGHPAMTDLRAVFTNATPAQIYNIVPRIVGGGSTQGTIDQPPGSVMTGYPKPAPNSRLYADVDELLFQGDHTTPNAPLITPAQLQASKFFLTAHSNAPEVNLFGLPRVACWPINADYDPINKPQSPYTTAFDRLIAFCSSTGIADSTSGTATPPVPYYFQRKDALNPTTDISIDRNSKIYKYLHYLTSQPIPAFSGSAPTNFQAKYPSPDGKLATDCDQILTEIFDYIRSTNLYDNTLDTASSTGQYEFTGTGVSNLVAKGYVVPSVVNATINGEGSQPTLGFGRAYTISNVGIGFICNADGNPDTAATGTYRAASNAITGTANKVLGGTALKPGQKYVQAILMPEFFSTMYGFISMWPNLQLSVSGLKSLSVTGADGNPALLFPDSDTEPTSSDGPFYYHDLRADSASITTGAGTWGSISSMFGGNPQWRYFSMGQKVGNITSSGAGRAAPARGNLPADRIYETYPLIGTPFVVSDNDTPAAGYPSGTMIFNGGEVTFTLQDHAKNTIQTITVKFPPATFPTPQLVTSTSTVTGQPATPYGWWTFARGGTIAGSPGRLAYVGQTLPTQSLPLTVVAPSLVKVSASPNSDYLAAMLLRPDCDVLKTLSPAHGDHRLTAGTYKVPDTIFQPERYYSDPTQMFGSSFTDPTFGAYEPGYDTGGQYLSYVTSVGSEEPDIPATAASATLTPETTLDYDNPLPDIYPGPYTNKPNEGSDSKTTTTIPYYYSTRQTGANGLGVDMNTDNGTYFSPNRMMPSPGMFGSLSTGVLAQVPWRTLLFRPQAGHYGATNPPDHLWLDLFWMPVVEPYAISDRFSTAGKINMNYQILPFTYITRSTGMNALFRSEMVTAIPNTEEALSKTPPILGGGTKKVIRDQIDAAQTLTQFTSKFSSGDVFKSASEICSLEIVPDGGALGATPGVNTVANMPTFWKNNAITGDNVREGIYTRLYPRLTTKSNSYTVYFTAQSLKQAATSTPGKWTEGVDTVQGEYRGSAMIERFIDANNAGIPDYAADIAASGGLPSRDQPLDAFYRWRVISNRQFAP